MREAMKRIHALDAAGKLPPTFNAALLNKLLGVHWAGKFLLNHCEGNLRYTALFERVARGVYSLKKSK